MKRSECWKNKDTTVLQGRVRLRASAKDRSITFVAYIAYGTISGRGRTQRLPGQVSGAYSNNLCTLTCTNMYGRFRVKIDEKNNPVRFKTVTKNFEIDKKELKQTSKWRIKGSKFFFNHSKRLNNFTNLQFHATTRCGWLEWVLNKRKIQSE